MRVPSAHATVLQPLRDHHLEHLTDHQIELVRAALERYAREQLGKQRTTKDRVDRLLDRMSGAD